MALDSKQAAIAAAHQAAVAAGEAGYMDPESGLFVQTQAQLASRGRCCGQGCRHCPYPAAEQRRAGRVIIRCDEPG